MALRPETILPQIYKTPANKKLLAATLEQLTSEPEFRRVQGFVGRRFGTGIDPQDYYVVEPNKTRTDYQLEPSVVFLNENQQTANDILTYPELLNSIARVSSADNVNVDQYFKAQKYSWDPFIDFDKFVNFSQYYWLPDGPDPVDVAASLIPLTDDFETTNTATGYTFSGVSGANPDITLVRGGSYEFTVDQSTQFWLQSEPGADGLLNENNQRSSRTVLGVVNNGKSNGTVTFNVPSKTAQQYYTDMPTLSTPVDLSTTLDFNQIDGVFVDQLIAEHGGIDGIADLDNRTLVFLDRSNNPADGGWYYRQTFDSVHRTADPTDPDPLDGALGTFDVPTYARETAITDIEDRYSIWLISYNYDENGENPYISLSPYTTVAKEYKFQVRYGDSRGNLWYYKDTDGYFAEQPLLTASKDIIYYQDGSSENKFGRLLLVDQEGQQTLDVEKIIGKKTYTSPNGVVFTNGLKIIFRGNTFPSSYSDQTYYVYGVGDAIEFLPVGDYVTPEQYTNNQLDSYDVKLFDNFPYDQAINQPLDLDYITISKQSKDLNPWTRSNRWFHIDVILASAEYNNATANLDLYVRAKRPIIEFREGLRLFNFGTQAKDPVNIIDTVETDALSNINGQESYRVDGFDVLEGTRIIFTADEDADVRNKIYEVNFVDLAALSPVVISHDGDGSTVEFDFGDSSPSANDGLEITSNGQLLVQVDGETLEITTDYTLDLDTQTITFTTAPALDATIRLTRLKIINLVPTADSAVSANQVVVALNGLEGKGLSYRFDGTNWTQAQTKTSINQNPLFDVFDDNDVSFSDTTLYPSNTFTGSTLFRYGVGTGTSDTELGFPLKYLNINNVGDIVFENTYHTDSFVNVVNKESVVKQVSDGYVHSYSDRTTRTRLIGWQTCINELNNTQIITQPYDGTNEFYVDVLPNASASVTPVKLFIDNEYIDPTKYSYTEDTTENRTYFTFESEPALGASVTVDIISTQVSQIGHYSVADNLQNNPFNGNASQFTLGTIRKHVNTIGYNLPDLEGNINGRNNLRDLGNILPYGEKILQHSSPVVFQGIFTRNYDLDLQNAIEFSGVEYEKFKTQLLDTYVRNEFPTETIPEILDSVIAKMAVGKTSNNAFYWTDMLPNGTFTPTTYTVSQITTSTFDLVNSYDFSNANYRGILVYLNGEQLVKDKDYTITNNEASVTVTTTLVPGDTVVIREYDNTVGSYMPATPTKLGMFPAFEPKTYIDNSYVTPQTVIQGHDGSITTAYGDDRDLILLELEKRIYNNIKIDSTIPLVEADVIPGQFRTSGYSLQDVNKFLSPLLMKWTAYNRLNIKTQNYNESNSFTYNYSRSSSKLDNALLPGNWRGIYKKYYDTDTPHLTPWEMLGFSIEPTWWSERYGPAPYTKGNTVLWTDLSNGKIDDPANPRIDDRYKRPGLLDVIPVDITGNLLDPLTVLVGQYDSNTFEKSYVVGDQGPVETAWRRSSGYRFSLMQLFAALRPSQFYGLNVDRDLYQYNTEFDQYLVNNRSRFAPSDIVVYGSGIAKHSYINFIVDYNKRRAVDSASIITTLTNNFDVRLAYRMASFTDKTYVKFLIEKTSPNSTNTSFLIPDESYQLIKHKNQAIERVNYSSVMIQRTDTGYAVFGNSITRPNFEINVSAVDGNYRTTVVGDTRVRINQTFTNKTALVPYGYEFKSIEGVVDFLNSYGENLRRKGFIFDYTVDGVELNWDQMIVEFLSWSQQAWESTAVININPGAKQLKINRSLQIANNLFSEGNSLLDVNQIAVSNRSCVVDRFDNEIVVRILDETVIGFLDVDFTNTEHVAIFDNSTVFNDLMYQPVTGDRQDRITLNGRINNNWNGQLDVPGYFLNEDNIKEWQENRKYVKGEIVKFKNQYWSASEVVQPSETFLYDQWIQSDYETISTGLLPNLATRASSLSEYYDNKNLVLNRDADLLATGLIGFRPRTYMTNINLDDVSQVGIYSTFTKTKGTIPTVELFRQADLAKEQAVYNVYENWALKRAEYGASDNRKYFEILLDADLLTTNPSVISIIDPDETIESNQTVYLNDLYKQSKAYSSTNILPTTYTSLRGFPTAGYVNNEDVDIQVFDADELTQINVNSIDAGTIIWVAKKNSYDWDIYRATRLDSRVIQVTDTLKGSLRLIFESEHGLSVDDVFALKYLQANLNYVYKVATVINQYEISVEGAINGDQTNVTGFGICLALRSVRVNQSSDISNLDFVTRLKSGDRVWVDNDNNGHWETIKKNQPYTSLSTNLSPLTAEESTNQNFGHSVAQTTDTIYSLIGATGYSLDGSTENGGIYSFGYTEEGYYSPAEDVITLSDYANSSNFVQLGFSIAIGNDEWAVSGAPDEGSTGGVALVMRKATTATEFSSHQLLTPPTPTADNHEFGYSVTMSRDNQWVYVGAPGRNSVYAYQLVEIQNQTIQYTGDGSTIVYSFDNVIKVDNATEIQVTVDGTDVDYADYTVDLTNRLITFDTAPDSGDVIYLSRRTVTTDEGDGSTLSFDLTGRTDNKDLFLATTADAILVSVDGDLQQAGVDYTMAVAGTVVFTTAPTDGASITYTCRSHYEPVGSAITVAGLDSTARFGHSVATTTDGKQVIIGTPGGDGADADAGTVYIFDRSSFTTVILDDSTSTIACIDTPQGDISVYLNNTKLLNADTNVNGTFDVTGGNTVRFLEEINQGPFNVLGTSNSVTYATGEYGYFYPLYLSQASAIADDQGTNPTLGAGAHALTFDEYSGTTFYMPNSNINYAQTAADTTIPYYEDPESGEIKVGLDTGDSVSIETNNFQLMQTITANDPSDQARFGYSVDQCPTNCSVYAGAPQNAVDGPEYGSVERFVNTARAYGTVTSNSDVSSVTPGNSIRINGINIEFTGSTLDSVVDDINNAADLSLKSTLYQGLTNVVASASDNRITIRVVNENTATLSDMLQVCPGLSNPNDEGLSELNILPYAHTQTIASPQPTSYGHFGSVVDIDTNADSLVVSAPDGDLTAPSTWINDNTTFDSGTTEFVDIFERSGAVFTFDYLPSYQTTTTNPGKFLFGQLIYLNTLESQDKFGFAVNQTSGRLMVTAIGIDTENYDNVGAVYVSDNATRIPAWNVERAQRASVETDLLNSVFMYDRTAQDELIYLDWVDPLRGKILGVASQNIDYRGSVDPAFYTAGYVHNVGSPWRQEHVGEIWWDTTNVRFMDYDQGSPIYASRTAGTVFPGSSVDVYQWISSTVPPSEYTGPGIPLSVNRYSTSATLNENNTFDTMYYFWVTGLSSVDKKHEKTLSTNAIAQYILNPRGSGIPYMTALRSNSIALYNVDQYLGTGNTVINVEYDEIKNDTPVHVEYELFQEKRPGQFINDSLYRKLLDSFCGSDTVGNSVPDPDLANADKYGINFRPRQSMFMDRLTALENYIQFVNRTMLSIPATENRTFDLLFAAEPQPEKNDTTKYWDKKVADLTELGYQNITAQSVGYRYLVELDTDNKNRWTIYEIEYAEGTSTKILVLKAVQTYDTTEFWSYADWYATGYSSQTIAYTEVDTVTDLSGVTGQSVGDVVKVKENSAGYWELYVYTTTLTWERIALQNGTIQISNTVYDYAAGKFGYDSEVFDAQYFDQEPIEETRQIIESVNTELFISDLLDKRNEGLALVFKYVLSEQIAPDWLYKTSLIDVDHILRVLQPFPIYNPDNQDFVADYINEVKPYRTQVREFNRTYEGDDLFGADITDFDLPAYLRTSDNKYVSPILDDSLKYSSSVASTNTLWTEFPYSQWYQTYPLVLESISLIDGGTGYTVAPEVTITGNATTAATARARINAIGNVIGVEILTPGSGYTETPTVTFSGGNGTGARARPIMTVENVRTFKTNMKFDRYEYSTSIVNWEASTAYDNNTLVRYNDKVYTADALISISITDSDSAVTVASYKSSAITNYQQLIDVAIGDIISNTITRNGVTLTEGVDYTITFDSLTQSLVTFTESAIDESPSGSATFDPDHWTLTDASTLSGVDRTMGLYNPDLDDVGYQLELLINGTEYPGVNVTGKGWESLDPTSGFNIDVAYSSNYTDSYLGTNLEDININGSEYIDVYNSHAPEELIPGSAFDTLDITVLATPGADYTNRGHAWESDNITYEVTSTTQTLSWRSADVALPTNIVVRSLSNGQTLSEGTYYTVDWINQTITLITGVGTGQFIDIAVYGIGGGNQLLRHSVIGNEIVSNTVNLDIDYDLVSNVIVFVNGTATQLFTTSEADDGSVNIVFISNYTSTDYVAITVMGAQNGTAYDYSSMHAQHFTADDSTIEFDLANSFQGPTYTNMIVEANGYRLRPPTGVEYTADGSTSSFETDPNTEAEGAAIADNDILVFVDYEPLILGTQFTVDEYDGSSLARTVTLVDTPAENSIVQVYVKTNADYQLSGTTLVIESDALPAGEETEIAVYDYRDCRQLNMLTRVFIGPADSADPIVIGFDELGFDSDSFDSTGVIQSEVYEFALGRTNVDTNSTWVSISGRYLTPKDEYVVVNTADDSILKLTATGIKVTDVIAITIYTQNSVPKELEFRVFQDMRDNRGIYRITPLTTSTLTQALTTTDTTIYVDNASTLPGADPAAGEFGIVMINGERITYREIDYVNNTISGLRRGTAGTGVFEHAVGSSVQDVTASQRLQLQYQDKVETFTTLSNGSQTVFTATDISAGNADSVQVYIGGVLQTTGYTVTAINPVEVTLDAPADSGLNVELRVLKGKIVYAAGTSTASDGIPLQLQTTTGARFMRGL